MCQENKRVIFSFNVYNDSRPCICLFLTSSMSLFLINLSKTSNYFGCSKPFEWVTGIQFTARKLFVCDNQNNCLASQLHFLGQILNLNNLVPASSAPNWYHIVITNSLHVRFDIPREFSTQLVASPKVTQENLILLNGWYFQSKYSIYLTGLQF